MTRIRRRYPLSLQFHEHLMTTPPPIASPPPPKRSIPAWLLAAGLSLLVSIAIVLPFFWLGTASGHDFEFHAASWLDAAYQWHEGTLYPRWTAWTNHGFGEPRFIFYPPLSWMLGAVLTAILKPAWVPVAFIVMTQTFAGISVFLLLKRLASERAAIFAAAFYAANPDALLIIYVRSDFAEQLACAFFPLVLLGALRLAGYLDSDKPLSSRIVFFAVPFAAVWLSNAPAGVIITYSVALLFTWAAVTQGEERIASRGIAGFALGFGLTSFYLIPAAYEQRWVNIEQALSSGLLPVQNFLFTEINDPEHTWFNWIASICALILILLVGLMTLASAKFAKETEAQHHDKFQRIWTVLLVIGATATLLTLRFTAFLWDFLPKLRFVQFPWRWMSILAVVAAGFLAIAIERRRGWLWLPALLLLSLPLGYFLINNGWWDPDEMPTQYAAITAGTGYDGTDEYDPLGDDHMDLPSNAPLAAILPADPDAGKAPDGRITIDQWKTEQKQIRVRVTRDARIALRLLNYPAWRVTLNGNTVTPGRSEGINQMIIPVPTGDSQIRAQFTRTPDRTLGLMLFSLSLIIVAILLLAGG
jgi:hypothetical protein